MYVRGGCKRTFSVDKEDVDRVDREDTYKKTSRTWTCSGN